MFENFKEVFSFSGQVQIDGKNVLAEYDSDSKSLRLGALTLTDASHILNRLTVVTSHYTVSVTTPETKPAVVMDLVDLPPPEPEGYYKTKKPKIEIVPDPVEVEERAAIEAEAAIPAVTPAAANDYLTPEITAAATLREVILMLADKGVREEADFIRICDEIRPQVAALKQFNTGVGPRISRILASIDGMGA